MRGVGGEGGGCLEQQRIASRAEADDEDLLSGLGSFQGEAEHKERVGGTGIAAIGCEIVDDGLGFDLRLTCHRGRDSRDGCRKAQKIDRFGWDGCRFEQALQCLRHDLQIPFIAYPALLPLIVVLVAFGAKMVYELHGARRTAEKFGDHFAPAKPKSKTTGAILHLLNASWFAQTIVSRNHNDVVRVTVIESANDGGRARTQRSGRVER